jgi:PhnB protein
MAITPYLYHQDIDQALAFLAKAFGFHPYGTRMRGADGKTSHAAMKLRADVIMLGRPPSSYRNPERLGQATQSLYVNVAHVDKHCRRAALAGAVILQAPTDTEYGQRRYGATDPEGHEWYFAHPIRRRRSPRR